MSSPSGFNRSGLFKVGLAAFLALAPALAEARTGNGSSSGSRGSRTQSAPAPTQTAPTAAQPMQRTTTPQTAPAPAAAAARPQAPAPAPGGFFSGAFGKGLLGGMIGAGLIGMFMGNGFGGGLGGMMSFIGLMLQVALIGGLIFLAWSFFARRRQAQQPAMAMEGPMGSSHRMANEGQRPQGGGFGGPVGAAPQRVQTAPIQLKEQDFASFEKLLGDIQLTYSAENIPALRRLATEEMIYYFQADIDEAKRQGHACKVSDVKLLQGDLSEAWREGADEFATVAMRFSLIDVTVDRATGRVVDGDPTKPMEVTEVWTFLRPAGAGNDAWQLSAIQQTA